MSRTPLAASLLILLAATVATAQEKPPRFEHTSKDPMMCAVCRKAYDRAMTRVRDQLRRSTFPVKTICGWLLLADGRHEKDLRHCIDCAVAWRKQPGYRARSHPGNWYPALAGVFLAEVNKHRPERRVKKALKEIIAHFEAVQERTGGWYKWHEGAHEERLDYPTVDLGYVTVLAMATLHTAKAQGIRVPPETLRRGEEWLERMTSDRGVAYGTSRSGRRSGGETTGGRGSHLVLALAYAGQDDHRVFRIYRRLLPTLLPKLDQGHHVGALHGLAVILGCHTFGPKTYRQLTDLWLDRLIAKQEEDGGLYIGDDGDAGGEPGLLRGNVGSTAAFALMILLQDHDRLVPPDRARNRRDGALTVNTSRKLLREREAAEARAAAAARREERARTRREARERAEAAKRVLAAEAPAWNAKLTARVRDAMTAGTRLAFRSRMLKRRVAITGVDVDGRLAARAPGGAVLKLAIDRLSFAERAEIAAAAVRPGRPEDHLLAAFFALSAGDVAAGKSHLAKGGDGAKALVALFRRIGRLPAE